MELCIRCGLSFVIVVGGFVLLASAQPQWASDLGLDVWRFPEALAKARENESRAEDLRARSEKLRNRAERKDEIIQKLAHGDLTLKAALTRMSDVEDGYYLQQTMSWPGFKGDTAKERLCRLLVWWAKTKFRNDPTRAREVHRSLQREMAILYPTEDLAAGS